jgi:outer membrane protein assembly factor BamD
MFLKYLTIIFLILCLGLMSSCSSKKPAGKTEAESLFLEAQQLIEKKRYIAATEKLNIIKTQHPYSFYAIPSELALADVAFLQENFEEAAAAYIVFRDMHPKHEKLDYVISRIAESFDKQSPSTFDRDLSSSVEAAKYYQELLTKYVSSPYTALAKERLEVINQKLLDKEKYIADFYFKTKNYEAALWRYRYIQSNVENKDLLSHAKFREVLALEKLEQYKECLDVMKVHAPFFSEKQIAELEKVADHCAQKWKDKLQ